MTRVRLLLCLGMFVLTASTFAARPSADRITADPSVLASAGLSPPVVDQLMRNVNPQEGFVTREQFSPLTLEKSAPTASKRAPSAERVAGVGNEALMPSRPTAGSAPPFAKYGTEFGYLPVQDCSAVSPSWLGDAWTAKLCANAQSTAPADCAAQLSPNNGPLVVVTLCQGTLGDSAAPPTCFAQSPAELDSYSAAILCAHIDYFGYPSCYDGTYQYDVFGGMSLFNRAVLCSGARDFRPLGCFIYTPGSVTVNDAVDSCSANQNWQTVGTSRP